MKYCNYSIDEFSLFAVGKLALFDAQCLMVSFSPLHECKCRTLCLKVRQDEEGLTHIFLPDGQFSGTMHLGGLFLEEYRHSYPLVNFQAAHTQGGLPKHSMGTPFSIATWQGTRPAIAQTRSPLSLSQPVNLPCFPRSPNHGST